MCTDFATHRRSAVPFLCQLEKNRFSIALFDPVAQFVENQEYADGDGAVQHRILRMALQMDEMLG